MKMGEAMYKQAPGGEGEGGGGDAGAEPKNDDVVDADFEEVDKNKK